MAYKTKLELHDYEAPAKLDKQTGEFTLVESKEEKASREMKDPTMEYFHSDQPFQRHFTMAWRLLETQTTAVEYKVACKLGMMAQAYTNCISTLTPESTVREIAEVLKVDKNNVSKIIDKLFKLGVIGKFEVYNTGEVHHKYWLFNPYLSFNGKGIKKDVNSLFSGTTYAIFKNQ